MPKCYLYLWLNLIHVKNGVHVKTPCGLNPLGQNPSGHNPSGQNPFGLNCKVVKTPFLFIMAFFLAREGGRESCDTFYA